MLERNRPFIKVDVTENINQKFDTIDQKIGEYDAKLADISAFFSNENLVSKDNIPYDHFRDNMSYGTSKFGIYFDATNGTQTTIRDLSLKQNVTYVLKLKANGNGETIKFVSFPDGMFWSNTYTVDGITDISYEFSSANAGMSNCQIKVIMDSGLIGSELTITDIVLKEKNEGMYSKGKYDKSLEIMNTVSLSLPNRVFDGRSNNIYNAFGSGVVFQGNEYYAFRQGKTHLSSSDSSTWGKVLLVKRKKGTLQFDIVDTVQDQTGDPRDVNLSVNRDGTKMFLSYALTADGGATHTNVYYVYDSSMSRSAKQIISTSADNLFGWGNMVQTPNGYLLKCAYTQSGSPKNRTVVCRSETTDPLNPGTFTKLEIASISDDSCTESTLAYWGNYLICMIRNTVGFSLVFTQDLEGQTGWSPLSRNTTYTIHSPCLMPYNNPNEDLYFTGALYKSSIDRKAVFGAIKKPNVYFTTIRATQVKILVIDKDMTTGGYTSLVPLSNSRFGVMYYRDEPGWTGASQFFMEVDKNILPKWYTDYANHHIWNFRDTVTKVNLDSIVIEYAYVDVIDVPANSSTFDFTYTFKEPATYDIMYAEGFVINRTNILVIPKIIGKTYATFTLRVLDETYIPTTVTVCLKISKMMSV